MSSNTVIWAEKYRPHDFGSLMYGTEVEKRLKKLVESEDFPHILFYGPNGAGKRTLTKCVLNELYGPGVHRMKSEIKEFKATASTTVDCVVYSSSYHQEVSPSETERYDRVVVNSLIKEMAGSACLNFAENSEKQHSWKVIVIHDLDKLSRDAQAGLRRTMEKYMTNCRIIFNCENLSRVLLPLKSRCVQIRVPAPK
jgi:replication factor C subunit 3/5